MPIIHDSELGEIIVRRHAWSKGFRATMKPNGKLHVSVPSVMPMIMVKRQIKSMRTHLKEFIAKQPLNLYDEGSSIGKTHSLRVRQGGRFAVSAHGSQLIVTLGSDSLSSERVQNAIRTSAIKIIRKQARDYLPGRLAELSRAHNLNYVKVRLSHAGTRWGSCSSSGTISLNIGLMNLPYELIDYVLLHELAHTKHMNHSEAFWKLVEKMDGDYKLHRKVLKTFSPSI